MNTLIEKRVPDNMNLKETDKYIQYLLNNDIQIANICVAQIEGETDWICFDSEHNIIIKKFTSQANAQNFLDALNERDFEQLQESGYFN